MSGPTKSNPGDAPRRTAVKAVRGATSKIAPVGCAARKGIAEGTGAQKAGLDVAVQQTTGATELIWEGMKMAGMGAAAAFVDAAGDGLRRILEVQRGVLDLAVQQTNATVEALREQTERAASSVQPAVTDAVQQGVNLVINSQRAVFELAARQGALAIETATKGLQDPLQIADVYKKVIDNTVETQKRLIDLVVEPLKAQAAKAAE